MKLELQRYFSEIPERTENSSQRYLNHHVSKYFSLFKIKVKILKQISHPNIIKIFAYGLCLNQDVETNCIIMEYAEFGSLHSG